MKKLVTSLYAVHGDYASEMRELEEEQNRFLSNVDATASWGDDDDEVERPYEVVNGVALYAIRGKMLENSNWFTRWLGISTYQDIGNALAEMAQDEEVNSVLISMSTPGGVVAGISDLGQIWSSLNAIKPIMVHTPSMLASAGIWLASNSSAIYGSQTAEAGSIGVIQQHTSYEKYLEKEGIKVTEIKSAPLKAIGSPAKDLTIEEKAHLEKKIMEFGGLFKRQVYTSRPNISEEVFTGEMFISSEATKLGLIDGVKTYSEVFSAAMVAADNTTAHGGYDMTKKVVTATMYEAAVKSGADPASMKIVADEEYEKSQGSEEELETPVEGASEGEDTEKTSKTTVESSGVSLEQVEALESELAAAQATVETLNSRVEDLESQLKAADSDPLRIIALDRIATMRLAFNLQSIDMSEFSTQSIIAEYKALDKQFKEKFKVGGFGKQNAEEPKKPAKVTKLEEVRLASV